MAARLEHSMTTHPLAGSVSVDVSARRIRQYRWLEERLMRILGGWIALTPELPIKLLFGRHVWDCAQHADLWGRRLPELRSPTHQGEPPSADFARLVTLIESRQGRHESVERVVAIYRVLKPHLVTAYATHLSEANRVYEPPTRRILDRCLDEERRHVAAGAVVLDRLTGPARARAVEWERQLSEELVRAGGLTVRPDAAPRGQDTLDAAGDLVALESAFDPGIIDGELASTLDIHRRALAEGDVDTLAAQIVPAARTDVLALYNTAGVVAEASVIACARIGEYRFVKLALRCASGLSVVQLEWRPCEGGWRIVAGELVRSEPTV
jgi:hypothetical protein